MIHALRRALVRFGRHGTRSLVAVVTVAGVLIANDDDLPQWNPGDEFEAARLEALGIGR